ncbi:hypothetical protein BC826DRAFT_1110128 [Russula brevipes]|nr:hypothetical protein BC826DRAFT_1110128 [Russula brevipes]
MSSPPSFSFSERVGLLLLAETSAVSACAILGLLSYIAYSAVSITRGSPRRWRIEGPAEVYFLNQLAWDLVQATGGLMNIKWAVDASVHSGPFCSAQGAVKQASDVGSALSSLIISIYTLRTLCFMKVVHHNKISETEKERERKNRLRRSLFVVACLWAAIGLLLIINMAVNGLYHFYSPTGFWCWIHPEYSIQRTAADFAFMWITTVFNIIIYGLLFLYFRGYITTNEGHIHISCTPKPINVLGPLKQACGLLFYPLVYTLTILPLSIVRYSAFAHHHIPQAATIFVDTIYLSSGLLNVLLFSFTRPFLLPHDPPKPYSDLKTLHHISIVGASSYEISIEGASTLSSGVPCPSPAHHQRQPNSAGDGVLHGAEIPLREMSRRNRSSESLGQ